jgi:hypothetical protein
MMVARRRASGRCQANSAACVRPILPLSSSCMCLSAEVSCTHYEAECQVDAGDCRLALVNEVHNRNDVLVHPGVLSGRFPYRREGSVPTRYRCFEPACGDGDRCCLPHASLLRCTRPGPGQVRDASPRADRRAVRNPNYRQLRLLTTGLLRGPDGAGSGWAAGAGATTTGSAASTQATPRNSPLLTAAALGRAGGSSWRAGRTRRDSIRCASTSAHHRAGVGAAPKIPGASTPPRPERPSASDRSSSYVRVSPSATAANPMGLAAEYENLRARVMGDPIVGRPAHGLAVLLRAGVAAWLTQLQRSTAVVDRQPISHRDDHCPAGAPDGDVATTILILASMVLAAQAEWTT